MNQVETYLHKRAIRGPWRLECSDLEDIECALVIPALAERATLFDTLHSLAGNPRGELRRTLTVVVVNNRAPGVARPEDITDNQQTLKLLRGLSPNHELPAAGLRLGIIDASSPGLELPAKGGVGLARKIGLDAALTALHCVGADDRAVLLSTDADTLVESNYLEAVRSYFARPDAWAATVAYAHRIEGTGAEIVAILAYETHLRYHVLGLRSANSPYAYPTVGSTIVCSARAYAAAGGMNRRQAGEDFYFLQQLAKTGRVDALNSTIVHPSPRPSHRVPFGTGRWLQQRIEGQQTLVTYHPEGYRILGAWLEIVNDMPDAEAHLLLDRMHRRNAPAAEYLVAQGFADAWGKLGANSANARARQAQFHCWFDAFRTLKLLHYLRDRGYPLQPIWDAVRALLEDSGEASAGIAWDAIETSASTQRTLLRHLRCMKPQ